MKGILFKEQLFRAVIAGEKTQTRRLVKTPKGCVEIDKVGYSAFTPENKVSIRGDWVDQEGEKRYGEWFVRPRYKKGDVVYLKEPYHFWEREGIVLYKYLEQESNISKTKYQNKLFMAAKYARYFIRITAVRVGRLQEITRSDIRAEGLVCPKHLRSDDLEYNYRQWYRDEWIKIWNNINRPPYSWEDNPFVWVYEFEMVKAGEAKLFDKLKGFGKIEKCHEKDGLFEIKITDGFIPNAIKTFKLMRLIDGIIGHTYSVIDECVTDENLFHYRLRQASI